LTTLADEPIDAVLTHASGNHAALGQTLLSGRAPHTAYLAYREGTGSPVEWHHIYVSTDGGYNWTTGGAWIPNSFPTTGAAWVFADPATTGRLYRVLTPTGQPSSFFVSPNDGGAWVEVPLPASASGAPLVIDQQSGLKIDPTGRLFLVVESQVFTLAPGKDTWDLVPGQSGAIGVVGSYVYIGGARSTDGGATFKPLAAPAPFIDVFARTAFTHRADPKLWLGFAAPTASLALGLFVGRAP
jgi:hypothetical protein